MELGVLIKNVKMNWKYPEWWSESVVSTYYHLKGNDGDNVFDYEWDNLVILDACSCEAFRREFSIRFPDRNAECRISNATCTLEFLLKTFTDGHYNDIVYISGNPYSNKVFKNKFYKIIPVWVNGWDDRLNTVPPENMFRAVLLALKKYPDKKFVIHFMQPHFPYINMPSFRDGSLKLFRENVMTQGNVYGGISPSQYKMSFTKITSSPIYLMGTREDHLKGYYYNLRKALDVVERLLRVLPGKTLITADHGDSFGEIISPFLPVRVYGHPWNIRIDVLKRVPLWVSVNNEYPRGEYPRKQVKKEFYKLKGKRKAEKSTIKNVVMRLKRHGKL